MPADMLELEERLMHLEHRTAGLRTSPPAAVPPADPPVTGTPYDAVGGRKFILSLAILIVATIFGLRGDVTADQVLQVAAVVGAGYGILNVWQKGRIS